MKKVFSNFCLHYHVQIWKNWDLKKYVCIELMEEKIIPKQNKNSQNIISLNSRTSELLLKRILCVPLDHYFVLSNYWRFVELLYTLKNALLYQKRTPYLANIFGRASDRISTLTQVKYIHTSLSRILY